MVFSFSPVKRPEAKVPDSSLDEALSQTASGENITLYFVNMVVISASDLSNKDFGFDKSDPYCEVAIGGISDKTPVIDNDLNPVWNEKMNFFISTKPDNLVFVVKDKNNALKDEDLGKAVFEFKEDFFELKQTFDGELPILRKEKQHGSIRIKFACRIMKPIETEIKLDHIGKELACKAEEQAATVVALDLSEELRKEAIDQLTTQEQEIVQKAQELEESQLQHQTQLSKKDQDILDQAQLVEAKIQQIEEVEIARMEAELKRQEAQTKLTEAEQEIVRKGEELEEKQRLNKEALTAKEKEVLAAAEKLEEKSLQSKLVEKELNQMAALKVEVENELTSKEKIILEQGKQLEAKALEHSSELTKKDKELLAVSQALAEKDTAAREAQKLQDENASELDKMKQINKELRQEVEMLLEKIGNIANTERETQQKEQNDDAVQDDQEKEKKKCTIM